jgi:hypothetical protein
MPSSVRPVTVASLPRDRTSAPARLRRRRGEVVGALLAALAISGVVLLVTWPQARFLTTKVSGHSDALFSVWRLAWVADSVATWPSRLFDAPIFYPHDNTLAYSDAILLSGLLTAPLRWLGVEPFAVYNVYLMFALIASGCAAALLCHRLTDSWPAAAVGGAIFTANPHRMEHLERIDLITSFAIPFAFYCWHTGVGRRASPWIAAAVLCVAVQWYLGMYQGLFLVTVLPCLAVDWWMLDGTVKRLAARGVIIGTVLTVLLIAPSTLPYLEVRQDLGDRSVTEVQQYSADLTDFAAVHPRNWLFGDRLSQYGAPERHLLPGVTALVLAAVGFWAAPHQMKLLYGVVLLVSVDLTLGTNGLLFPWLRELAVPYRGLRAPARAAVMVMLPVSVFAAVAVARMAARVRPARALVAVGALLAAIATENVMRPNLWDTPRHISPPSWMPPSEAVLFEYPVAPPHRLDASFDAHYMVGRIGTWTPMVNGYTGYFPRDYIELLEAAVDFPSGHTIDLLRQRGVTHIAIHQVWLEGEFEPLTRSLAAVAQLEMVAQYPDNGGDVAVFRLVTTQPSRGAW